MRQLGEQWDPDTSTADSIVRPPSEGDSSTHYSSCRNVIRRYTIASALRCYGYGDQQLLRAYCTRAITSIHGRQVVAKAKRERCLVRVWHLFLLFPFGLRY